jgi:anhydro-N-acetylmuramic acid kinase
LPRTTSANDLYVGLMSGTSVDAIDAALVRFSPACDIVAWHSHPIPEQLRSSILELCQPGDNEIDRFGQLDVALGDLFAEATLALLDSAGVSADAVTAIGSHGQTVRHRPGDGGFSLQLGSADVISARTGIATVANFRNHDMVLGGQGAPLVPAFHASVFGLAGERRVVANIGGMANITVLDGDAVSGGYDTGPGNVLMDSWIYQQRGEHLDHNGEWAASGQCLDELLADMLTDDFIRRPAPKSTGREDFDVHWLARWPLEQSAPADVQATLLAFTARSLADAVNNAAADRLLVCGGGARNDTLMRALAALCNCPVTSTDDYGVPPEQVEAAAFAWLARARMAGAPGNAPAVTGANRAAVLGALYLP